MHVVVRQARKVPLSPALLRPDFAGVLFCVALLVTAIGTGMANAAGFARTAPANGLAPGINGRMPTASGDVVEDRPRLLPAAEAENPAGARTMFRGPVPDSMTNSTPSAPGCVVLLLVGAPFVSEPADASREMVRSWRSAVPSLFAFPSISREPKHIPDTLGCTGMPVSAERGSLNGWVAFAVDWSVLSC